MNKVYIAFSLLAAFLPIFAQATPKANSLESLLNNACSAEELGKVTKVKVLDAKQANSIYKIGRAPQIAKTGEIYVQIFAKSRAVPSDFSLYKTDRRPSDSEISSVIGKPTCTVRGE